MSTPHLGSPRHSSKQRRNQREGRKGFHGTPGKVRDSESVSTPQVLQGCPAAPVLCCNMCIVNHPVLGWVTFADPSTWDPLGKLWPQSSTALGPQGWGLLQSGLSPALLGRPLQGRSSGAGARTRGMHTCSPPARLCRRNHEAELVFLF